MTAHVLQGFDRLTAGLAVRPERTFLAALALILAGAIVGAVVVCAMMILVFVSFAWKG